MPIFMSNNKINILRKELDVYHYLPQLMDHIRGNYPNASAVKSLSDAEFSAQVRRTLHRAWNLQLFSKADVFTFAAYDLVFFPNFGKHPQIRQLLESSQASPDIRMLSLCSKLTVSDWKRLKEECELLASESEADRIARRGNL